MYPKRISVKKGDVTDILTFLILIFILGVGLFLFAFIIPAITTSLNEAGLNQSTETTDAINALEDLGVTQLQRGFFLLFVGISIATFISAFLVRAHPIFLFLYILFYGITIFLGTYLGNAYDEMRNIPLFADTLASQTLINLVFENLLLIVIGIGAISMIIVFAKFSNRVGGDRLG